MKTRPLGATGVEVPRIGQGTWQMEGDDRADAVDALRRGLDAGLSHIDSAELYGSGVVEEIVGEAIAGRRDEVFLASKVLPHNASRDRTQRACESSLARLGTDRIDLYILHWPGEHPIAETLEALEALVEAGKIRFYGVSNFDDRELAEAVALAGPGRIACNQVLYHLRDRRAEHVILPFCELHEIAFVGYSPFGAGSFPSPDSAGGRALDAVAAAHGATARQIALAFLTRRPSIFAIPKAARATHVVENSGAIDLELGADELARLDNAFPLRPRTAHPPAL